MELLQGLRWKEELDVESFDICKIVEPQVKISIIRAFDPHPSSAALYQPCLVKLA